MVSLHVVNIFFTFLNMFDRWGGHIEPAGLSCVYKIVSLWIFDFPDSLDKGARMIACCISYCMNTKEYENKNKNQTSLKPNLILRQSKSILGIRKVGVYNFLFWTLKCMKSWSYGMKWKRSPKSNLCDTSSYMYSYWINWRKHHQTVKHCQQLKQLFCRKVTSCYNEIGNKIVSK